MLTKNTLLKIHDEDTLLRILWSKNEWVVVTEVLENRMPYSRAKSNLESLLRDNKAEIVKIDPFAVARNRNELKDAHKEKMESDWLLIKDIINDEPKIYHSSYRTQKVKEIADNTGKKTSYISNLLKRYWNRGMVKNTLMVDYYRSGAKGVERLVSNGAVKRGRPSSVEGIEGKNICEEDKRVFSIAINKYYYSTARRSLMRSYELMKADYYWEAVEQKKPVPTYSQFLYWFKKRRSIKREVTSRSSNKNYLNNHKAIVGSVTDGVRGVGTMEIDGHVGNTYLVSSYNRNWLIGRPTIFCLIDRVSGYVSGISVFLDSSIGSNIQCIYNMFQNKEEYCSSYGVEGVTEDMWMSGSIPQTIVFDRGEGEGTSIESAVKNLSIDVVLTPPFAAQKKPMIENLWALIDSMIDQSVTGFTDPNSIERGDVDPRLKGALTLQEYTRILIKTILYFNNHRILENYEPIPEMIADGFERYIPRDIFNWCQANLGNTMKRVTKSDLILGLLPTEEIRCTKKGLVFKKMRYSNERYLKEGLFVKAREKTFKVRIAYDPRDLSQIYIYNDDMEKGYEVAYINDQKGRYLNKSIEEIEMLLSREKKEKVRLKNEEEIHRLNLLKEIRQISNSAKKEVKKTDDGLSKRQRLSDIKENRKIEKQALIERDRLALPDLSISECQIESKQKDDALDEFFDVLGGLENE